MIGLGSDKKEKRRKDENMKLGLPNFSTGEKRESRVYSYYWGNARKTKQLEIWQIRHLSGHLSSDCDFRPAKVTKGVKLD